MPLAGRKGGRAGVITAGEIEASSNRARAEARDIWLTDPAARGQGRFTIRCTPAGARVCMFRHTRSDGTRDILKLADYDPRGVAGTTLQEAREKAGELARQAAGGNNLRMMFAEREQSKAAAVQADIVARRKAEQGSLQALFRAYVTTLDGRQSHYDAQSIFKLHVSRPFEELVAQPAAQITAEQLRDVLASLSEGGKGRAAAKLRAYLRAA